ncbi:MAG: anti-sigma factor family protein [Gemmatimonadota bacterium]
MDCRKASELLEASIDGRLGPREESQVRAHVDSCPSCAAEEAAILRVGAAMRRWSDARVAARSAGLEAMWTRVAGGIEERRGGHRVAAIARRWFWVPVAAALAVWALLIYSSDGTKAPFRPRSFDVSVEFLESDSATVALVDKGEELPRVIWIIEDGKT